MTTTTTAPTRTAARPSVARVDAMTMLRRNLLRMRRYPGLTIMLVGMPVLFLLLFVYVFGGTLGAGLPGGGAVGSASRADYLAYVTPAILVMTVASCAQGIAITVAMDKTEGVVARFRTMAIARSAFLTGHVLAAVVQAVLTTGLLLLVALALGFRPSAGPLAWLGLVALVVLASFALTWVTTALGLQAKSVETASNLPMVLVLLPFLGSGFVPVESMPVGLRWFAEYQPFTPLIETVRDLLAGSVKADRAWLAVGWCAALTIVGYAWARRLDRRYVPR